MITTRKSFLGYEIDGFDVISILLSSETPCTNASLYVKTILR